MTDPTRSARSRRGGRRPGWLLLTVLLVLAIGASSALVFTNRVELLKFAVILALWAAVIAAFVSVIYRRQSDIDQARVRDLKLVYDLQLDREISARREYELSVETHLRRELTSEIRTRAADEVAGLRAELAALRANLEILFDADLSHRPAIETERAAFHAYRDWAPSAETTGRVTSSRIDTEDREVVDPRTDESPIIDVPAEPSPPDDEWTSPPRPGGAHRRPSDVEPERRRHSVDEPVVWSPTPVPTPPPAPPVPSPSRQEPERVTWQPAPADGRWVPAGAAGSNWVSPAEAYPQPTVENGSAAEYVGRRRAPDPAAADTTAPVQPAMSTPSSEPPRGRHSASPEAAEPGRPAPPPTLAADRAGPRPHSEPPTAPPARRRHRSADEPQTGGQSVAELLARLQTSPTGGGRRRRRDE